jgi:transposase
MHIVYHCCCGMDVHKKMLVACVLSTGEDGSVQKHIHTFSTMTSGLLDCLDWLESLQVEIVAMESTGVYTPPPMLPKVC